MQRAKPYGVQTITALVEIVTGGRSGASTLPIGYYRSGPDLEEFLGRAGLDLQVGNASRVPSVREVLNSANRAHFKWAALDRLIVQVCDPREYLENPEKEQRVVAHLNRYLEFDDFELRKVGKGYQLFEKLGEARVVTDLGATLSVLDFDSVSADLERAQKQAAEDPEGAVTAACSIVESVCKCILDELEIPYPEKQDIQSLAKAVGKALRLDPAREDLPELSRQDIRQVLGGLQSVAGGVGALRTHAGDAHGRGKKGVKIDARIARLAVHSASTISLFYIETWQLQTKSVSTLTKQSP